MEEDIEDLIKRDPELAPSSYHFSCYDGNLPNANRVFYSRLFSGQCRADKKNGERCTKRCVIGIEFCHIHMPSVLHLQIRNAGNMGLGLFAYNPNLELNAIVFERNDVIIPYEGEALTEQELNDRYDRKSAPYAMEMGDTAINIDGAIHRGIGTMINHANKQQSNVIFLHDEDNNRIILSATKPIKNNQQLFANYGNRYKFKDDHRTRKYPTSR
jgi:hypothetical protein